MKLEDKLSIFMQTDLSTSDFKVLTFLYQPLVGIEAYAIYSVFYQLAKSEEELTHRMLLDILNIKKNDFNKYREKLEALGLLESYEKNNNEYIYILKPPFTAKQFLTDTFLGTYLESEIGEKNLKYIMEIFKVEKPVTSEFKNITKSFDDLYHFDSNKLLKVDYDLEGRNGNNSKLIKHEIDYEKFVESIPRALISPSLLNDNFKQKIVQLAFVYQFSIEDLVEIYANAHKGRKNITIAQMNLQAKLHYEKKDKNLTIMENEPNAEDALSNVSYLAIVEKFSNDDPVVKSSALSTINDFISQNEIDPGVLNVILIFLLKNKEGYLPNVNYINKVWESWAKNGVQSATDALKYKESIERSWAKKSGSYQGNKQEKVNKPSWLDEYIEDIKNMEG